MSETMKKYTQADFDALKRDENGYLHLESGDWTAVDFDGADRLIFADGCTLGDCCTLGDRCTLESGRVCNATYFKASNIGSRNDSAYAYCDTQSGDIYVRAGCWFSGIDAFEERVKSIHGGTQHEVDYLAFAAFARARFARYAKKEEGEA